MSTFATVNACEINSAQHGGVSHVIHPQTGTPMASTDAALNAALVRAVLTIGAK